MTDTAAAVARLVTQHKDCCCDDVILALITLHTVAKVSRDALQHLDKAGRGVVDLADAVAGQVTG
jgi:hypothetical protein